MFNVIWVAGIALNLLPNSLELSRPSERSEVTGGS